MEMQGKFVKLCILFSFLLLWKGDNFVNAQGQAELYQLMDDLFTGYKPEVRPTTAGEATWVYVAINLLSIQNLDEKNQVLETSIFLEVAWVDDYLSWDPANYGNANYFMYPQKKIWLPDLVVKNSVETQRQLGYDQNQVIIESSGLVTWYPSQVIDTSCDIDVTYYPFDTQTCSILFSTWVSYASEIDVNPDSSAPINLDFYSPSGTWELLSTSNQTRASAKAGGPPSLEIILKMRRLRTFYILNIIIPVLFLSFTASMVFFLPADAGEKMGMSITVLLAYAVYLTIIADNMPQTSLQVSILSIYLIMLLAVTALAVIISVLVLHMHHKPEDEPVGEKTKRLTRSIRRRVRLGTHGKDKSDNSSAQYANGGLLSSENMNHRPPQDTKIFNVINRSRSDNMVTPFDKKKIDSKGQEDLQEPEEEEEITWQKVGQTVDRVCFFVFSIYIAFSTIVFLLVLAVGGYTQ